MSETNPPLISVIIPAYNESNRLISTLERIQSYMNDMGESWEILVVSDGSTDDTCERVRSTIKQGTTLRLIERKENKGKGYSVREGMLAANGQYRLFCDADNSTDIAHLDALLPLLKNNHNLAICTRNSKDAQGAIYEIKQSAFKRLLGTTGNLFIQLMAVPGIWDTQCGFKAFTADAAKTIFSKTRINRWGFDIEVLAIARQHNMKIGIAPARWRNDNESKVTPSAYIEVLLEALRIRWNILLGRYK